MRRIAIIGPSAVENHPLGAAGPHPGRATHRLDAIHWGPNWTPPSSVFCATVDQALSGDGWVVDGAIARCATSSGRGPIRWCGWMRASRSCGNCYSAYREAGLSLAGRSCGTAIETWYGAFIAPDSLFRRTLRTYRRRRRQYRSCLPCPNAAHLRVVRLNHPARQSSGWRRSPWRCIGSKNALRQGVLMSARTPTSDLTDVNRASNQLSHAPDASSIAQKFNDASWRTKITICCADARRLQIQRIHQPYIAVGVIVVDKATEEIAPLGGEQMAGSLRLCTTQLMPDSSLPRAQRSAASVNDGNTTPR